jgi:hypothetical protein
MTMVDFKARVDLIEDVLLRGLKSRFPGDAVDVGFTLYVES